MTDKLCQALSQQYINQPFLAEIPRWNITIIEHNT